MQPGNFDVLSRAHNNEAPEVDEEGRVQES
jgi:hypothetical protein